MGGHVTQIQEKRKARGKEIARKTNVQAGE
jgi:hypothetical protein